MNQAGQASKAEASGVATRRAALADGQCVGCDHRAPVRGEGFAAVATTSGGVSWALGAADGESPRGGVGQTARIARARVPGTADIEAGFGETPGAVESPSATSFAPARSA
jgi:2-methylisocitrate lyase-like PEP mutase family enzyme